MWSYLNVWNCSLDGSPLLGLGWSVTSSDEILGYSGEELADCRCVENKFCSHWEGHHFCEIIWLSMEVFIYMSQLIPLILILCLFECPWSLSSGRERMIDETSTIIVPVKVTFPCRLINWHSVYVYPCLWAWKKWTCSWEIIYFSRWAAFVSVFKHVRENPSFWNVVSEETPCSFFFDKHINHFFYFGSWR